MTAIMSKEEFYTIRWHKGMKVKVTNDFVNGEVLEVAAIDFDSDMVSVWVELATLMTCPYMDVDIIEE